MASYVFNKFKADLLRGQHVLSGANDIYSVALIVSAGAFSAAPATAADVSATWFDVSASWAINAPGNSATYNGTNYTPKGLSGMTVTQDNTDNEAEWDASDVTWASSTIDADGCVIYKTSNGFMICGIDFGAKKSSSNGDFTIQWNTEGILNLN